jgi:hypothetical protein
VSTWGPASRASTRNGRAWASISPAIAAGPGFSSIRGWRAVTWPGCGGGGGGGGGGAGARPPPPLLGMMGAFQFAPDPGSGHPLLHTYSGVLARFEG